MGSTKLYVGNLSYSASEEGLAELFSQFGDVVSTRIVKDRETGRSRGFGFVEMMSAEDGEEAIRALNGQVVDGRPLTVNEARPQEGRQGGGGGGPRRGFGGGGGGGGGRYRD